MGDPDLLAKRLQQGAMRTPAVTEEAPSHEKYKFPEGVDRISVTTVGRSRAGPLDSSGMTRLKDTERPIC